MAFVDKSGDTMTGGLTFNMVRPFVRLKGLSSQLLMWTTDDDWWRLTDEDTLINRLSVSRDGDIYSPFFGYLSDYINNHTPKLTRDFAEYGDANAMDPQWGIVGNGYADDAPAINAMIAAVAQRNNSRYGGRIFFPARVYAIGSQINLRSGIYLVGAGPTNPNLHGFTGSQFSAKSNMDVMVGQNDYNQSINSCGIEGLTFDAGADRGITVHNVIRLSPISCKITNNHISKATGVGIRTNTVGDATERDASWINWIVGNFVEKCLINLQYESTDSYITNNYFSFGRFGNVILDSAGNNQFIGNMVDNTGKDENSAGGQTPLPNTENAFALEMKNRSGNSKSSYDSQNTIVGNCFINNNNDVYLTPNSVARDTNHVINDNRFHFGSGRPILIGSNNNGGIILGNAFHEYRYPGNACINFDGFSTGWSLGPNVKNRMEPNSPLYLNLPGMAGVDHQIIGFNN